MVNGNNKHDGNEEDIDALMALVMMKMRLMTVYEYTQNIFMYSDVLRFTFVSLPFTLSLRIIVVAFAILVDGIVFFCSTSRCTLLSQLAHTSCDDSRSVTVAVTVVVVIFLLPSPKEKKHTRNKNTHDVGLFLYYNRLLLLLLLLLFLFNCLTVWWKDG